MSLEKPRTNVEVLIRHLSKGDIILNSDQEQLFIRLTLADQWLRSRKYDRDTIITMLRQRFSITSYRANQDITDAHKVFGETRKLNKNFLLSHHIEEIGRQIQIVLNEKRYELLPKLNDSFTYAINSIPREIEENQSSPAKIVYVFNGTPIMEKKDLNKVLQDADNLLKGLTHGEYIDYEELRRPGKENNTSAAERTTDEGADDIS
ncbi:hypothetical protein QEG73_21850 [Chitinophagaceae bacterium 26-R-25]|nr:hypothetical protein [Chitinophagaceae bacterium 26-R-25]